MNLRRLRVVAVLKYWIEEDTEELAKDSTVGSLTSLLEGNLSWKKENEFKGKPDGSILSSYYKDSRRCWKEFECPLGNEKRIM
jgi:hypothetical protein